MALVYKSIDAVKPAQVKNLGWLIRHIHQVKSVDYIAATYTDKGTLTVDMTDGKVFVSHFADNKVARVWLRKRRALKGVPLEWYTPGYGYTHTTCDASSPFTCEQLKGL